MTTKNPYVWQVYESASDERKADILAEMNLSTTLHDLTWRGQCDTLEGAPVDVMLKYLPIVSWEAQVWMWRNALPVGARKQAIRLLSEEAKVRLRLKPKYRCLA